MRLDSYDDGLECEMFDRVGNILISGAPQTLREEVDTPNLTVQETIERLNALDPRTLISAGFHIAKTYPLDKSTCWECLVPNPQTGKIEDLDIERSYRIELSECSSQYYEDINERIYHKGISIKSLPVIDESSDLSMFKVVLNTKTFEVRPQLMWKFKATVKGVQKVFIAFFSANKDAVQE